MRASIRPTHNYVSYYSFYSDIYIDAKKILMLVPVFSTMCDGSVGPEDI